MSKPSTKTVGGRIRGQREFREIELWQLAQSAGLAEQDLEAIEADEVASTPEQLRRLAAALRIPVEHLRGQVRMPNVVVATGKRPYTDAELAEVAVLQEEMTEEEFRLAVAAYVRNPDRMGNRVFAHPAIIDDTQIALLYLLNVPNRSRLTEAIALKKRDRDKGIVAEVRAKTEQYRLRTYLRMIESQVRKRSRRQTAADVLFDTLYGALGQQLLHDLDDGDTIAKASKKLRQRIADGFPDLAARL